MGYSADGVKCDLISSCSICDLCIFLVLEHTNDQVIREGANDTVTYWSDFVLSYNCCFSLETLANCLWISTCWSLFCFSLVLSALLVKLIRISRIFLRKSISKRPTFTGSVYQIVFTFILVGVQMSFVLVSMIVVYPGTTTTIKLDENNHNDYPVLSLQCTSPHIALIVLQMLYFSALLIASNALAVLTIRCPANFNESKYVSFSTFSLGLMWFLFILSYIATDKSTIQTAVVSSTIQLSALQSRSKQFQVG